MSAYHDEMNGVEDGDGFHSDVMAELYRHIVSDEARRRFARRKMPPLPPFDGGSLTEILARPPEPPFRVDELLPADGSVLLSAQRKTGKTTLTLNLVRSLLTGEPFLGRFPTRPLDGNIGFLNYEVSGSTLGRWADDVGIPGDRLFIANLRGRRNPLGHPEDTENLAAWLRVREIEALIVDPFANAYAGSGSSQNDAGEVAAWLVNLGIFARAEVGAKELILTAHAGWNGERTRGSSALEDWPDAIWHLAKGEDEDSEGRYLRAVGRDVDLEEDRLSYDPRTRLLTLSGTGSRKEGRDARALVEMKHKVLIFVRENPGCSGREIEDGVRGDNRLVAQARRALIADGVMVEEKRSGRGGGMAYTVLTLGGAA